MAASASGLTLFVPFQQMITPQMEDKPLLPMDGAVDRREWTLQHRKAADITLTPPQADLDMDCLDVNVKGPGTVVFVCGCFPPWRRQQLARSAVG